MLESNNCFSKKNDDSMKWKYSFYQCLAFLFCFAISFEITAQKVNAPIFYVKDSVGVEKEIKVTDNLKKFVNRKFSSYDPFFKSDIVFQGTSIENYEKIIFETSMPKLKEKTDFTGSAGLLNTVGKSNAYSDFIDLGSKITNIHTRSASSLKFSEIDDKTLQVVIKQKSFNLDLINRGIIAFDSLRSTANEYINSIQGAPITLRNEYSIGLSKKRQCLREVKNANEPNSFLKLGIEGRFFPSDGSITEFGKYGLSGNFILTYYKESQLVNDSKGFFYFFVAGNFSFINRSAKKALYIEESKNVSISIDGRCGLKSETVKTNNLNLGLSYRPLGEIYGNMFSISLLFAPE